MSTQNVFSYWNKTENSIGIGRWLEVEVLQGLESYCYVIHPSLASDIGLAYLTNLSVPEAKLLIFALLAGSYQTRGYGRRN